MALLLAQSQADVDSGLPRPRSVQRAPLTAAARLQEGAATPEDPAAAAAALLGGTWRVLSRQGPNRLALERVLLERVSGGLPVAGELARVNALRGGGRWVTGHLSAARAPVDAPVLDLAQATAIAAALYDARWQPQPCGGRLELLPCADGARAAWRVDFLSPATSAFAQRVRVDARSGAVLEVEDLCVHHARAGVDGTAYSFLPNPVQSLDDPGLSDQNNSATAVPLAGYFPVVLRELDGSGRLNGPWASTSATKNQTVRPGADFSSYRDRQVFEEALAYYHVDTLQRRLQSLGLNARREQQKLDVNDLLFDQYEYANASYNQFTNTMIFGTLGVDFAEDADVVLHEYAHSLHDNVQGGIGGGENGAVSEGFGDFFACQQTEDALLGEWVATSLGGWSGYPAVRRCDEMKRFPADLVNEVHADGEIWSGALWEAHLMIGADAVLQDAIEGLSLGTMNSGMQECARNFFLADRLLFGGAHERYLQGPFVRAGLVPAPAGAPLLFSDRRRLTAGAAVHCLLTDAARPLQEFQVVFSRRAQPSQTGAPFDAQLDIGSELLPQCQSVAAFRGCLDATGMATFALAVPARLPQGEAWFAQAMLLDASGRAEAVSPPIAFRAEQH